MRVKLSVLIGLFATSAFSTAYAIQPQVGDISDNRTTGQFFRGMEIELKLVGDDLSDIAGIRTKITSAVDETGKSIVDNEKSSEEFEQLGKFGSNNSVKIKLSNPARKASTVKQLAGTLELYMPNKDPESTIALPLAQGGKPATAPALVSNGIELTVMTKAQYDAKRKQEEEEAKKKALAQGMPESMLEAFGGMFGGSDNENSIYINLKDPKSKIIGFKLIDEAGKEIDGNGSMSSGDTRTLYFSNKIPEKAALQVQVATNKAVSSVPFDFQNVALP